MKIVIRDDEKKDKAVSAIIGTILIVAITVVLAATLYAVLGGFSGLIGKPTPTASMTVSSSGVGTTSGTENYTLSFTSVSSSLTFTDIQVRAVTSSGTSLSSTAFTTGTSPVALTATMGSFSVDVYNVGTGNTLTFNTLITIKMSGSSSTPATALSSITLIDTSTGGTIASASNV
jgi:flagellin-like protein